MLRKICKSARVCRFTHENPACVASGCANVLKSAILSRSYVTETLLYIGGAYPAPFPGARSTGASSRPGVHHLLTLGMEDVDLCTAHVPGCTEAADCTHSFTRCENEISIPSAANRKQHRAQAYCESPFISNPPRIGPKMWHVGNLVFCKFQLVLENPHKPTHACA